PRTHRRCGGPRPGRMADMSASGSLPGTTEIVDDVATAFARLVVQEGPRSIALSGGATAEECYAAVRALLPDWSGVDVFMSDERFVPPTEADSNEGMARRVLLDHVQPRAIHSMFRPGPIEDTANAYDELVRAAPPIDIVH